MPDGKTPHRQSPTAIATFLRGEQAMMNFTDKRGATGLMAVRAMICCQVVVGATRLCFAADKTGPPILIQ